jgi:hypothetical protein
MERLFVYFLCAVACGLGLAALALYDVMALRLRDEVRHSSLSTDSAEAPAAAVPSEPGPSWRRDEDPVDALEQQLEAWLLQTASRRDSSRARIKRGCAELQQLWEQIDALPNTSATALPPLLGALHRAGVSAVWDVYIAPDPYNSTVRRLWLDWADTLVPYDVATAQNSSYRAAYVRWALATAALMLGSEQEAAEALDFEAQLVALMQKAGDGYVETQHLRYDAPGFAPHCIVDNRATPATKGYNRTTLTYAESPMRWRDCASLSVAVSGLAPGGIIRLSATNAAIGVWTAEYSCDTETWIRPYDYTAERNPEMIYITPITLPIAQRNEAIATTARYAFYGTLLSDQTGCTCGAISADGAARVAYLEALFGAPITLPIAYAAAGGYVDDALALVSEQNDLTSLRSYLKLRVAVAVLDMRPFAIQGGRQ